MLKKTLVIASLLFCSAAALAQQANQHTIFFKYVTGCSASFNNQPISPYGQNSGFLTSGTTYTFQVNCLPNTDKTTYSINLDRDMLNIQRTAPVPTTPQAISVSTTSHYSAQCINNNPIKYRLSDTLEAIHINYGPDICQPTPV